MTNEYQVSAKVKDILGYRNYYLMFNARDAGEAFNQFDKQVQEDLGVKHPRYLFKKVSLIKHSHEERMIEPTNLLSKIA
jgi:hypothetical protein